MHTKFFLHRRGSALLLILGILFLITILIVGVLQFSSLDRAASQASFQNQRAKLFADMGLDYAIAEIRDAITAGSVPATSATSGTFWASQPGRITVFNANGTVNTASSRTLISQADPTLGTAGTVDLNQISFSGNRPISAPYGVTAPAMPAAWINVLQDPLTAPGAQNKIVGRYAFWVDDETTKMDINTADGTVKAKATSFGPGTPPEVSLQSLTEGGVGISSTQAAAISTQSGALPTAGTTGRFFSSIRDILGVPGVSSTILPENLSDITTYSRAPELNIFGEPRIYLANVSLNSPSNTMLNNNMVGAENVPGSGYNTAVTPSGMPLREIYPSSGYYNRATATLVGNQLPYFIPSVGTLPTTPLCPPSPYPLPQFFSNFPNTGSNVNQIFPGTPQYPNQPNFFADDYMMGLRIAQYLEGKNSQGTVIQWPAFPGAGTSGFAGKYTDRQIDSIALQILSLLKLGLYPDQNYYYAIPYVMPKGFLSGLPVCGVGLTPKVTQVQVTVSVSSVFKFDTSKTPPVPEVIPCLSFAIYVQWFLPDEFQCSLGNSDMGSWAIGNYPQVGATSAVSMSLLNFQDAPPVANPSGIARRPTNTTSAYVGPVVGGSSPSSGSGPCPLGSNSPTTTGYWMNQLLTVTDQNGQSAGVDLFGNDPTQPDPDQANAKIYHPYTWSAASNAYMGSGPGNTVAGQSLGACPALEMVSGGFANWQPGQYRTMCNRFPSSLYPTKPGVTTVNISGGLNVWATPPTYPTRGIPDPTPLDSMRGPIYTGEDISPGTSNTAARSTVLAAVIPINMSLTVPAFGAPANTSTVTMQVADPLVNKFPGDWQVASANLPASAIPTSTSASPAIYTAPTGVSSSYLAANGGDPAVLWWPPQLSTIPKIQRFPSAGYLQYVHTGMMPDPQNDSQTTSSVTETAEKGVPFRLLNFSPSTDPSQATAGGTSYPDWAMLDLFTVPASLQANLTPLPAPNLLTYGGATTGRINPNATLFSFPTVTRTKPLQGLMRGIQVVTSYDGSNNPIATTVNEQSLATAIASYEAGLQDSSGNPRPLFMPAEICNIPAVAALVYGTNGGGRNDLVRQIVGNMTTRSNTFSVWVAGQAVQKIPSHTNYGTFEAGDTILGESRVHYIVERMIDPGKDGSLGNTASAGADGVVGTPDDPVDSTYNPAMTYPLPYKYRVVSSEIISK